MARRCLTENSVGSGQLANRPISGSENVASYLHPPVLTVRRD